MTKQELLNKIKIGLFNLELHPDYLQPDARVPLYELVKELAEPKPVQVVVPTVSKKVDVSKKGKKS